MISWSTFPTAVFSIFTITILTTLPFSTVAKSKQQNPYTHLAQYLSKTIPPPASESASGGNHQPIPYEIPKVQSTLSSLSKAQSTLKSIDGASHEFYQRSHSNTVEGSSGRVERSAGRVGCCADSLFGCELLDWMDDWLNLGDARVQSDADDDTIGDEEDGTLDLHNRKIILNTTIDDPLPMQIVVLFEEDYAGGAGMAHGGIDGITPSSPMAKKRGRYLILLKDSYGNDMEKTLECLDSKPEFFDLNIGLVSGEVASVNRILWNAAQKVMEACAVSSCWNLEAETEASSLTIGDGEKAEEDELQEGKEKDGDASIAADGPDAEIKETIADPETLPALHFVGRSLAGGVASLAAGIADGSLPMPLTKQRPRRRRSRKGTVSSSESTGTRKHRGRRHKSSESHPERRENEDHDNTGDNKIENNAEQLRKKLEGYGRGRSSAVALGPPPSISANIKAAFITSVIVGDDIICRASKDSLDRLRERAKKRLEGGLITKQMGWMTDTLSLTVSSLQSHAHGSEGEEARLSIPGKVYLVRPRSIGGGVSSIHEIGRGRDALRAAVLWQLNDVLLSRSLWKHHSLESYIRSLDKVQLRQISEENEEKIGKEYDL